MGEMTGTHGLTEWGFISAVCYISPKPGNVDYLQPERNSQSL